MHINEFETHPDNYNIGNYNTYRGRCSNIFLVNCYSVITWLVTHLISETLDLVLFTGRCHVDIVVLFSFLVIKT